MQTIGIPRRTVKDKQTMKEVVLTDQELEMIDSIQNKRYPASADDPYQVNDFVLQHMMRKRPIVDFTNFDITNFQDRLFFSF